MRRLFKGLGSLLLSCGKIKVVLRQAGDRYL